MTTHEYKSDLCDVNVVILRSSEKAVLCEPAYRMGEACWFPLSQVEISDNGNGTYQLTGPDWLMREKGFV